MKNKKYLISAPLVVIVLVWMLALSACSGSNPAASGGGVVAPTTPTGVTVTPASGQNTISWNTIAAATSYKIYGGTTASAAVKGGILITTASATPYPHNGLANGTVYYYVVTAVNGAGESSASAMASATPNPTTPPSAPTNVTATAISTTQIDLTWTAPTGNVVTGYNLYRSTTTPVASSPANLIVNNIAATSYNNIDLAPGTTYYYVVTALNSYGEGPLSAEASAATIPNPPTITGFTPTNGPVGTRVTITGTNFDSVAANNTVKFNGTTAIVTSATTTQIVTIVPVGATTGPLSVTTVGGMIASVNSFTVSPFTQNRVYVTNFGTNTISVIDTTTNTVVATIPVGTQPDGVDVDTVANRAFVVSSGINTIFVINTITNTVVTTIPVGSVPMEVAVNPLTNRAYVVNNGSNSVSVIDTTFATVVTNIPVGLFPMGVAVNPMTNRAYVTNYGAGSVSVINTTLNTVAATISTGGQPEGVAVNSIINRAYVAIRSASTVSVIDTTTNTVIGTPITVGAFPHGVAVNHITNRAYVTNSGAGTVSVINTATNAVVATIPVGAGPFGVAVIPSGNRAYVTNLGAGTVSVINTATNAVVATIPVGGFPHGVAVAP